MSWFDAFAEDSSRLLAKRTSRRGLIGYLGTLLVGAGALPLLPVARGAAAGESAASKAKEVDDPTSCNYWRHCAIDGYLCGCCGGSENTCPPGTQMSAVTWV